MCAYFYVNPQSYEAPKSVITGFLRFLDFISNFDWKNQVLLIDFNNEMKGYKIHFYREFWCSLLYAVTRELKELIKKLKHI